MPAHKILGGKVSLYKRSSGDHWHCSASINGKQFRNTTHEAGLPGAKDAAEDWYLTLRGKARTGVARTIVRSRRSQMPAGLSIRAITA